MRFFSSLALILIVSGVSGCNGEVEPSAGPEGVQTPPASLPPATMSITPASQLPAAVVGAAYSTTLNATGGTPPYRWQITSGALPAGIVLDESTGVIAGTAATAGTTNLLIVARDANTATASANLSLQVVPAPVVAVPLVITTAPQLPVGLVGAAYSTTLTSTGGTGPYLWQVTAGSLPAGMSLDQATGVIAGTPTSAGTASLTVAVRDASAVIASLGLSLQILPAPIVTPPLVIATAAQLPGGVVGAAYSTTLSATGGTPPYRWQVTSGALPAGISLNQTNGVISGTPTSAVTASAAISLTDANAVSTSAGFTLRIGPPALTITSATQLPNAVVGATYSTALNASGGAPPYRWQVTAGALPAGLSLNQTTGVIAGTPTSSVTATPSITVTDANAASTSATISLRVTPAALAVTTATQLPGGVANTAYSMTLAATGGAAPYRWVLVVGSLPAGLSLNQTTGVISGTPTSAVAATFSVAVTDAASNNAYANLALTVTGAGASSLAISSGAQLPTGTVNVAYSTTLAATGGTAPYNWQISSGALPAGLSLNQTSGVISGTPTSTGTATPSITVTDASGGSSSRVFSLQIASSTLAITTASLLPDGVLSLAYVATLSASGGTPPYRWAVTSGTLPTGLSLNQTTGLIVGTPLSAGNASLMITVTDANSVSTSAGFSLRTGAATLSVTTAAVLPGGTANVAYSTSLAATGGTTPYSWQVTAGNLPAGLSLNQTTGVISGTPTGQGSVALTVAVTDSNNVSTSANFTLTVNAATAGWQLAWSDEFNGSGAPNPSDWGYETGHVRNNEAQYYTNRVENARQENGSLVIEGRKESFNGASYTSASVITRNKRTFLYGRFEIRAKLPAGRGTWPAIWMLNTNGSWPAGGEIDIMEYVGFESNLTHSNVFTSNIQSGQYFTNNPVSDVTAWHVYALEWFTDRLDFFVDGVKVNTFPNLGGAGNWPFDARQYLLLNLAIGGAWGGLQGIDDSIFPARYEIDYVRYYTKQ